MFTLILITSLIGTHPQVEKPRLNVELEGRVDRWGYVYLSKNREYLDRYVDQPWFFVTDSKKGK